MYVITLIALLFLAPLLHNILLRREYNDGYGTFYILFSSMFQMGHKRKAVNKRIDRKLFFLMELQ